MPINRQFQAPKTGLCVLQSSQTDRISISVFAGCTWQGSIRRSADSQWHPTATYPSRGNAKKPDGLTQMEQKMRTLCATSTRQDADALIKKLATHLAV